MGSIKWIVCCLIFNFANGSNFTSNKTMNFVTNSTAKSITLIMPPMSTENDDAFLMYTAISHGPGCLGNHEMINHTLQNISSGIIYTQKGLVPFSVYKVELFLTFCNETGNCTEMSKAVIVNTKQTVPAQIQFIDVQPNDDDNSVTVAWQPECPPMADIVTYRLRYYLASELVNTSVSKNCSNCSEITIQNLQENAMYIFQVQAISAVGAEGTYSNPRNTTLALQSKLSTSAIIGICIGITVLVCAVIIIIVVKCFCTKCRKSKDLQMLGKSGENRTRTINAYEKTGPSVVYTELPRDQLPVGDDVYYNVPESNVLTPGSYTQLERSCATDGDEEYTAIDISSETQSPDNPSHDASQPLTDIETHDDDESDPQLYVNVEKTAWTKPKPKPRKNTRNDAPVSPTDTYTPAEYLQRKDTYVGPDPEPSSPIYENA